jgi:hypothetical protein
MSHKAAKAANRQELQPIIRIDTKKEKNWQSVTRNIPKLTLPLHYYLHLNMALFVESYFCLPPEGLELD